MTKLSDEEKTRLAAREGVVPRVGRPLGTPDEELLAYVRPRADRAGAADVAAARVQGDPASAARNADRVVLLHGSGHWSGGRK